jgi:hypothetical protein
MRSVPDGFPQSGFHDSVSSRLFDCQPRFRLHQVDDMAHSYIAVDLGLFFSV